MTPQFTAPDPRIDGVRGSLAVQRGLLVYCVEAQDRPTGTNLTDVVIDTFAVPAVERINALQGAS